VATERTGGGNGGGGDEGENMMSTAPRSVSLGSIFVMVVDFLNYV
jgi:hypothetical protein